MPYESVWWLRNACNLLPNLSHDAMKQSKLFSNFQANCQKKTKKTTKLNNGSESSHEWSLPIVTGPDTVALPQSVRAPVTTPDCIFSHACFNSLRTLLIADCSDQLDAVRLASSKFQPASWWCERNISFFISNASHATDVITGISTALSPQPPDSAAEASSLLSFIACVRLKSIDCPETRLTWSQEGLHLWLLIHIFLSQYCTRTSTDRPYIHTYLHTCSYL